MAQDQNAALNDAQLKEDMRGLWPAFFSEHVPQLHLAMAQAPEHCACPVHGGQNGLRLFADWVDTGGGICNTCGGFSSGFKMTAWALGITTREAKERVARWLQAGDHEQDLVLQAAPVEVDWNARKLKLETTWREGLPLTPGTPAWAYLQHRGLIPGGLRQDELDPDVVRWHPALPLRVDKATKTMRSFPTLLTRFQLPDGTLGTVHRTILTGRGQKAAYLEEAKKVMAIAQPLSGGAVRLFKPGRVLGVGEGIETMYAAHVLSSRRIPVWACTTAVLLENVVLPPEVEEVHIFVDKDRPHKGVCAGERAAALLAARLTKEGRKVFSHLPSLEIPEGVKGVDWLDELNRRLARTR